MHSTKIGSDKYSGFYYYLRRISFYYLWKIHSSEYNGYKDFKKYWDPSSSKGNLDNSWKDETLTKEHFTFRNIHQNLGNIRW
jgi:hypothetical protein